MTFVGNSPVAFKNIKLISPVPTKELADILKRHDIFLVASEVDACSNTLIEALHCGLPAVARDSASHPEIIGAAGEFFEGEKDVINAIQKVSHAYTYYKQRIEIPTLDEVGQKYYEFAQTIYEDYSNGNYLPKQRTLLGITRIKIKTVIWKISGKIRLIIKGIRKRRRISR
jgi:glycosyltransferase involved in cell wall biosynthesis